jgi:hypothetical protein
MSGLPHLLHAAFRTPPPLMTVPDTDIGKDPVSASDLYVCLTFYWLLTGLLELHGLCPVEWCRRKGRFLRMRF